MKTVLITGISRGIGRSLADKFLKEGYIVIGTYFTNPISPKENLFPFYLDLSSSKSIESCAGEIQKLGKKINILINNAAILCDRDETGVIVEKLRKTLEINLIGTIDFTENIIPFLEKEGHVVNISSSAGSIANTGVRFSHFPNHQPSYKISKTALNMYTRTLSLRLKDSGIIVSSVHPGWVKTDMGGSEADIAPEEAARNIFNFAISTPTTGQFWFNNERMSW